MSADIVKIPVRRVALGGDALFLPFCGPMSKKRPPLIFKTGEDWLILARRGPRGGLS